MKNWIGSFVLILTFALQSISYSQGEAAIPFLVFPTSPTQTAMGVTGTSLPTDDPYGFLLNPAQLGYTSQSNNLSFIFYPSEINWLGGYVRGLTVSGIALNLGYNFKNRVGIPISVGIGFANPELNYGEFIRTTPIDPTPIGTFESKDYYYAYSMGIGVDYFVQFNAGITYKSITSILSDQSVSEEQGSGKAEVNSIDYGLLLNIPIIRLIDDNFTLDIFENVPSIPFLNLSFGLSRTNIGDEVYYIDPAQSDPLPRSARLGYGVSTGMDLQFADTDINIFDLAFTVDAWDILIERDTTGKTGYQSGLGDIDFGKHVIQIKGDDKVVSQAGLQISLMETLVIRNGHFSGRAIQERKTNGIEIRAKGLLKLLNKFSDDQTIKFIADHFDVRYYNTNYFADHALETKITGIALVINGFEFW
ncbi:hypothetical protein ACFLQ4_01735 [Bacteroidota bacterium]